MRRSRTIRRSKISIWDICRTLIFFGLIVAAIAWLDQKTGRTFTGTTYVIDGDTLVASQEKLRLAGIDAPEIEQFCSSQAGKWPCGRRARGALRNLTKLPDFKCRTHGIDKYDRWLVTCFAGKQNINELLVEQGWAVDYGGYGTAEKQARVARNGIWRGAFNTPQEWRRLNKGDLADSLDVNQNWISSATNRARGFWRTITTDGISK